MFDLAELFFRRTRQIGIDRLTEFFFVLIFFLFPWYSSGRVLISRGGLFLWSCENQIFLMRLLRILSQRFLKASRRILEVLNFLVKRKSKLSSLWDCPLGQMSDIFVTGPRLRWSFFLWSQNNFYKLFLRFSFNLFKFLSKGNLKGSSWSCGRQIFRGLYLPCFREIVLDNFQDWCVLPDTSLDLFLDFSIFFLRTREGRDEKIDQTSANSSDAILL